MILGKNGQVAYCGPTADLPCFLESVGHPLPDGSNLAEFALDLVDCDPTEDPSTLRHVTAQWPTHLKATTPSKASRSFPSFAEEGGRDTPRTSPAARSARGTSFRTGDGQSEVGASMPAQVVVHLRRQSTLAFRDPVEPSTSYSVPPKRQTPTAKCQTPTPHS